MEPFENTPLSDDEFDWLSKFLLERIDDNADSEGRDKGILDTSELDGLLTAVVSSPVLIPPSLWLPQIWGQCELAFDTERNLEHQHAMSLFTRHMNAISATLTQQPGDFKPIFIKKTEKNKTYDLVDKWCEGYMRGVALAAEEWDLDNIETMLLIAPMTAFNGKQAIITRDKLKQEEIANLQESIPFHTREMYAHWQDSQDESPVILPPGTDAPRVGRDDPCPCGSGKPYKKCCLH